MIETNRIELKREFTRGVSLPRNRELMRVFRDVEMVEALGSGMNRIMRTYGRDNFEFGDNYIRMIVPYNWIPEDEIVDENGQKNVLENNIQLTERQKSIISRLFKTGEINVLENVMENSISLANYFGVSERTIRRDLQFLQKHGYIRHIGPDKGGKWQVIDKKNNK